MRPGIAVRIGGELRILRGEEPNGEPAVTRSMPMPAEPQHVRVALQAPHLPLPLRAELLPALENLVQLHRPEGVWLFGSWARGSASRWWQARPCWRSMAIARSGAR